MEDISRTIARIIDGLRPAAKDVRGRPLQQFVAGDEALYLRTDTATTATRARGTDFYGSRKYGVCQYDVP